LVAPDDLGLDLYIAPLGTGDQALAIAESLRARGIKVDLAFGDKALKGAMKSADKSGAKYSIVLGADEVSSGVVSLKEMKSGGVASVTLSALANEIIERITNYGDHS
jgi:histidyl-tRNA synthetase